jgi:hypothetical protein
VGLPPCKRQLDLEEENKEVTMNKSSMAAILLLAGAIVKAQELNTHPAVTANPRSAAPVRIEFVSRRAERDSTGAVKIAIRVAVKDEGAQPVAGETLVLRVVSGNDTTVFDEQVSGEDGSARLQASFPPWRLGSLSFRARVWLKNNPAVGTGETTVSLRRLFSLDLTTNISARFAPREPNSLDKLFDRFPQSDMALVTSVTPELGIHLLETEHSRLTTYGALPAVAVTRGLALTLGPLPVPVQTEESRAGPGDWEAGIKYAYRGSVVGGGFSVGYNGRNGLSLADSLPNTGRPTERLQLGNGFNDLNTAVEGKVRIGGPWLFAQGFQSLPLKRRISFGSVARAERTQYFSGGIEVPTSNVSAFAIHYAYTRLGLVERFRQGKTETILPAGIDRQAGISFFKQANRRLNVSSGLIFGGFGERLYLGGSLSFQVRVF